MVKKEVMKKTGGFPPYEFGEDAAFAKIAVHHGFKFGILKDVGSLFVSPRRLEKNGFFKMLFQYIYLNGLRFMGKEFERGKKNAGYW